MEYKYSEYRGMIYTDRRFLSSFDVDQDEIAICGRVDSTRVIRRLSSVFQR